MENNIDLKDIVIVSCGTLNPEIKYLRENNMLEVQKVLFTAPGLHEDCNELEKQLIERIEKAKEISNSGKVIVLYGGKFCYVNGNDPYRTMKTIIEERGPDVVRVDATHCMDMLASGAERDEIAGDKKVFWFTPGWVIYRHNVFKGWDKGLANENFPRHDGGVVILDGIDFFDNYMNEKPEEILEYSDWMGVPISAHKINLDRFKSLLIQARDNL